MRISCEIRNRSKVWFDHPTMILIFHRKNEHNLKSHKQLAMKIPKKICKIQARSNFRMDFWAVGYNYFRESSFILFYVSESGKIVYTKKNCSSHWLYRIILPFQVAFTIGWFSHPVFSFHSSKRVNEWKKNENSFLISLSVSFTFIKNS